MTDSIDLVGSMTNNPQNCQSAADPNNWDRGHEGHSGYLAIDIANQLLEGWLAAAQPDIVQFMLGTNDVFQSRSLTDILAAYTRIVELSRASNPNMKIIVGFSFFSFSSFPPPPFYPLFYFLFSFFRGWIKNFGLSFF